MIPAAYDIQARRNADYQESFSFKENGQPFDLTGYTFALQVRAYGDAPDPPLISVGMSGAPDAEGIYVPTPANGQISIVILEATIDALVPTNNPPTNAPSQYVYDLALIAGLRSVVIAGNFLVALGVTR